jgi:hypothetical protein
VRHVSPRRLATSLALLALAALAGAGAALGIRALVASDEPAPPATVTIHAAPPAAQQQAFDPHRLLQLEDGRTLNDIGYILVQAHRDADAIPILQKAVRHTSATSVTGAYARFNLGLALVRQHDCAEGIRFMQRALPNEPADQRRFVRRRISFAQAHCR